MFFVCVLFVGNVYLWLGFVYCMENENTSDEYRQQVVLEQVLFRKSQIEKILTELDKPTHMIKVGPDQYRLMTDEEVAELSSRSSTIMIKATQPLLEDSPDSDAGAVEMKETEIVEETEHNQTESDLGSVEDEIQPVSNKQQLCTICYEAPADGVYIPCGHACCYNCSVMSYIHSMRCPYCRMRPHQIITVGDKGFKMKDGSLLVPVSGPKPEKVEDFRDLPSNSKGDKLFSALQRSHETEAESPWFPETMVCCSSSASLY